VEDNNGSLYYHYNNHTDKYLDTDGIYAFVYYDNYQIGWEKFKVTKYYTTPVNKLEEKFYNEKDSI
jgi:hypothetical protein